MSKKIFIVGRKDAVSRISFDTATKSAKAQDYESVVPANVEACTRINCLAVVVRVMEQLAETDMSKDKEPNAIFTVGMVADAINKGTFKYWVLNGGKKSDGTLLHATEIELWNKFAELYPAMYTNLIIRNVSDCTLPKNSRFTISQEQRIEADFATKAWDRVKVTVPEIEESVDEAI